MNSIVPFLLLLDPWFIAPFRWLPSETAGYLLGAAIIALQCIIIGDLSATLVAYLNRGYLRKIQEKMDRNHRLSEQALMQGDKESYKAVNRQGLDAFGYQFSMGAAIFCVSIWPMPFSLAWMNMRFAEAPLEMSIKLPFIGQSVHYFASFLLLYIAVRMSYSFFMARNPWYTGLKNRIAGIA
ncbi:MAG: hypothetical protein KJ630_13395 [Proteobacteria bacterium]|nr:hypothetical protein [Pseudomonadota bacterium]